MDVMKGLVVQREICSSEGRAAAGRDKDEVLAPVLDPLTPPPSLPVEIRDWKPRLVQRGFGTSKVCSSQKEFSARIEHAGTGYFFPLDTEVEEEAACRAQEIYARVLMEGWPGVLRAYPREFTLAIFWGVNPTLTTYATAYTVPGNLARPDPPLAEPIQAGASVSVAIVEADAPCRRALGEWVGSVPGYACGGLFSTGAEALEACGSYPVDLALVNRQLSDLPADELIRTLRRRRCSSHALAYQIYECSDDLFILQPRVSGGYFFRRRPPRDLLEPIAEIWSRGLPADAEWRARIDHYFQRLLISPTGQGDRGVLPVLTSREHEILSCLCRAIPDKEIASALDISAWTVHTHLKRIYEKFGVHSRAEAILKFLHG